MSEATRILNQIQDGDPSASEQLAIVDEYCIDLSGEIEVVWDKAASIYALSAKAVLQDNELLESQRLSLKDEYCAKALDCLRRALATEHYSTPPRKKELLDDEDFSVLRDHPDFQQLCR